MLIEILKIIGGLIALIFGGDLLLRSAVAASNKFKISKIVIGMTVVSFATSLPELIVSVRSATLGYPDLALGNIVGSNIANLGFVLAIILLFTRIKISNSFYKSDWPMMFIASVLLWAFIQDANISFYEGIIFLFILIVYTVYLVLVRGKKDFQDSNLTTNLSWAFIFLYCLFGSILLSFGSDILVDGSISIAYHIGVSERVIGITVVSVGTSIPELAACLVAVLKKENAISIGNLLGSNLFNIMCVLGITALINPIVVNDYRLLDFDINVMIFISILILLLVFIPKKMELHWRDGLILIFVYTIFIAKTLT